jgi:hypothetical protein
MLKIYCAGAYSANGALPVLHNMQRGIHLCIRIARAGMLPCCPWNDHTYGLMSDMPLPVFIRLSMEELRRSDAMIVVSGSDNSVGTRAERKEASLIGIPVFEQEEFAQLVLWAQEQEKHKEVDEEYRQILEAWNVMTDQRWRQFVDQGWLV